MRIPPHRQFFGFFKFTFVTPMAERFFTLFDEDGSGELDFGEFIVAVWQFCTNNEMAMVEFAFDVYDTDKSGEIDVDELEAWVGPRARYRRAQSSDIGNCFAKPPAVQPCRHLCCFVRQNLFHEAYGGQKHMNAIVLERVTTIIKEYRIKRRGEKFQVRWPGLFPSAAHRPNDLLQAASKLNDS